jgi:Uma2 family endonuclease
MTVEEFMKSKYFDDGFWELYKGELVAMSPASGTHDIVVMRLSYLFQLAIGDNPCIVAGPNSGLKLDEDRTFVCPDIIVYCDESIMVDGWYVRPPVLVVEVLSKRTRKYDLNEKKGVYREFGVKEFWAIDFEKKVVMVENLESGKKIDFEVGEVVQSFVFPEFRFEVVSVFKKIMKG